MGRWRSLIVLVVGFGLSSPAVGQQTMYGSVGSNGAGAKGVVGTVDQTTGAFTELGDPTAGNNVLAGITFDASGRLFGVSNPSGSSASLLIEIDPITGALLSPIGTVQTSTMVGIRIVDLATQPGTDVLFGIDDSGTLWTLNKTTAIATVVGATGLARGGIAFAPNGTLYLTTVSNRLVQLNPSTGLPTTMPLSLDQCFDGLAVRPSDGLLFGTECDSNDIDTIDPTTGDVTFLGTNDQDTTDLAFQAPRAFPAPSMSFFGLVLLATALGGGGYWLQSREPLRTID